jgi:hypothetical protein
VAQSRRSGVIACLSNDEGFLMFLFEVGFEIWIGLRRRIRNADPDDPPPAAGFASSFKFEGAGACFDVGREEAVVDAYCFDSGEG